MNKVVTLSLKTVLEECGTNKDLAYDYWLSMYSTIREMMHEIFKYHKFNQEFSGNIDVYNDGSNVIGYLKPSYKEFLFKLGIILNTTVSRDEQVNEKNFRKRLEVLNKVSSLDQLQQEFPVIYKDYIDGKKYITDIRILERKAKDKNTYKLQRDYYYGAAMAYNFDEFMKRQRKLYERFVSRRELYKKTIEKASSFNGFLSDKLNLSKLALYTAYERLNICRKTSDRLIIKYNLDIVKKYIDSSEYAKYEKVTKKDGTVIDFDKVFGMYVAMNQKLKNIDVVNWELVPEGTSYKHVKGEKTSKRQKLTQQELHRLQEKGLSRNQFYNETNYLAKAVGTLKNNGYVARIYPNGKVILDRDYENDKLSTAEGNALYIIDACDFEALSRLDKTTLKNHPNCIRMNHSKGWEEKVLKIINEETTEQEQTDAIQLVKRLKERNGK